MKTFLVAVLFLVIGAAIGGFLIFGVGAGMGAGTGIVVGSQAGACLAVETAKEKGLLTAEQIDDLLTETVAKITGRAKLPPEAKVVGSQEDCAKMIADMRSAVEAQQQ